VLCVGYGLADLTDAVDLPRVVFLAVGVVREPRPGERIAAGERRRSRPFDPLY
jgi:hypothetical protein